MLYGVILSFALLLLGLYWLYARHLAAADSARRERQSLRARPGIFPGIEKLLPRVAPHDLFPWGKAFFEPSRRARESRQWELLVDLEHRAFWYCRETSTLGFWRIDPDGAAFWQEWRLAPQEVAHLRRQYVQEGVQAPLSSDVQQRAVGF